MRKLINRPSLIFCLLGLFLLLSQGAGAQATISFAIQEAGAGVVPVTSWDINWTEINAYTVWPAAYDAGQKSFLNSNYVTYSSSNSEIATAAADANGCKVTVKTAGTVTITAHYTGTETSYNDGSYTLTINDNRTELSASVFSFSSATAEATYGGTLENAPTLNTPSTHHIDVEMSSSNTNVATISFDKKTYAYNVTIVGAGKTDISATFTGDSYNKPTTVKYTLTVAPKEVGLTWGTAEFTYDGSAHVPTATAIGLVGNDACTVTVDGAQTNAGSYTATASALSNTNYKLPAANTKDFTIAKATSSVTAPPTANTLTYTGSGQALVNAGKAAGGTMQYSIDNQTFAEPIPLGINAGNYTVYYKVVGDANHTDAAGGQVSVTIAKADATVTFVSATVNAKIGENFTAPTATTTPSGLALTYASSTTSVATVDASTGAVTLKSAGSTTITASFAGNANYNAAEGSYTLNVSKADAVSSELSFSSQTAAATYGDASVTTPTLNNPHQVDLTWTSSDKNVATVNNSGVVTIVGAGQTVISAAFAGNDTYSAATISYTLTVNKAAATVAFASATVNAKIGESFTAPTATTTPSGLALTYASSNTSVATVNASTGAVTLVADGSTTITASFAGNNNYNATSASYTLTVSKADNPNPELKDPQISFSSTTATATYGDESVTTPTLKNPLGLSPIVWSSSAQGVATVNSQGQVTIQNAGQTIISAIFAGNAEYAASTVFYILTIDKAVATVSFPMDHYVAQMGKDFDSPIASVSPDDPSFEMAYTSSDKQVARVNTNTGVVSLKGAGKATITATFKGSTNYHHAEASYVLTVLGENEINPMDLDPVDPDAEYSFETTKLVDPDGTEMDLSNAVIENHFIVTMKNQDSPLGDGYDPDLESLVINTVTGIGNATELLDKGIIPGSEEWAAAFTGLVFMLPEDENEGELIITSQEAKSVNLMVQVGDAKPVAINSPELEDYSIPCKNHIEEYVYLWNGGKDSDVSGTRGKKAAVDVRVRKVTYKSKGSSGIERVLFEASEDDLWFSLSGQRISKPTKKGVYIHGHQKVVIK